jgi:hypothetical protein
MIHITKSLTMLVVFLLVSATYGATGNDQQLKLEIELSKMIFLVGEPIWLDVTLTNVSTDTVRILGLCLPCRDGSFDIEIEDGDGNVMTYSGPVNVMTSRKGWLIEPNEQYYNCFNLSQFYGSFKNGLIGSTWLRFLPPGKYRVRALYLHTYSQRLEFEVLEPEGEEKQAYDELYNAFLSLFPGRQFDSVIQRLEKLIERFPNSVYIEKAYWHLPDDRGFLQRFPNSGFNESNLRILTSELASEQKREFLEKVIQDYPESRSAKFARQMLKWLEE